MTKFDYFTGDISGERIRGFICSSPVSVVQNCEEKEISSSATRPPRGLLNATSKTT